MIITLCILLYIIIVYVLKSSSYLMYINKMYKHDVLCIHVNTNLY